MHGAQPTRRESSYPVERDAAEAWKPKNPSMVGLVTSLELFGTRTKHYFSLTWRDRESFYRATWRARLEARHA